jgi:alpha-L-rhamnosidase
MFATAPAAESPAAAQCLRCEYLAEPLAIDAAQPRLSWEMRDARRGAKQTAYQILVASAPEKLVRNEGDLWDSGRVASDRSTQVVYAGKPLRSRMQCHWKLRIWDADGKSSVWSEPAGWSMGLLTAADWKTQWIGGPRPKQLANKAIYLPAVYLRKPFTLTGVPQRAVVYATAAGLDELHLNGKRVGNDFFTPGWTNYDKRIFYQAYDVTSLLRSGENVIGTILGDGWYGLHHGGRGRLALLAQLHVEYADGSRQIIASDPSWKATSDGPIRMSDMYQGETYDARKEMPGWDAPGFNDAAWVPATTNPFYTVAEWRDVTQEVSGGVRDGVLDIVAANERFGGDPAYGTPKLLRVTYSLGDTQQQGEAVEGQTLHIAAAGKPLVIEKAEYGAEVGPPMIAAAVRQGHPGSPVRKTQELKPIRLTEPKPGKWTFDLGQNFSGWVRLKVKGPAGTTVVLRFAEMLNPDGTVYTTNLRAAKSTDTYVLRGEGEEVWEPRFTFHGFQYVEVSGLPAKPSEDSVVGVVLNSDAPLTSSFECSNPMLNRLFQNIVWGQRSNYLEIPTDCPQRDERMGWSGDAQAFIGTATYNMDVAPFFTAWLRTYEDCQSAEGAFADIAPVGGGVSPGWGDAGVICPWTIYRVYGDQRMLQERYRGMTRWIEWLEKHSKDCVRPDEGYGDWLNVQAEMPKDVIATAFFAYSTSLMEKAARALGKDDDAARFRTLLDRIKAAFNRAFVGADGLIKGDTQTTYLMALGFDLLPPEKRPMAVNRLVELIEQRKTHLSTGFLGVNLLLPVLTQIGRADLAYTLLQNETYPSWGYPVKHGATTIWERWDGWTEQKGFQDPGMNSFNHYAYGSCGQWMFSTMAGIDTDGPGYQRIIIRPRLGGGISFVKAAYDSIHGPIAVDWRQDASGLKLNVTIPANTTATVYVPAKDAASVSEGGKPAGEAPNVKFLRLADGAAVYQVDAGSYEFVSAGS